MAVRSSGSTVARTVMAMVETDTIVPTRDCRPEGLLIVPRQRGVDPAGFSPLRYTAEPAEDAENVSSAISAFSAVSFASSWCLWSRFRGFAVAGSSGTPIRR